MIIKRVVQEIAPDTLEFEINPEDMRKIKANKKLVYEYDLEGNLISQETRSTLDNKVMQPPVQSSLNIFCDFIRFLYIWSSRTTLSTTMV